MQGRFKRDGSGSAQGRQTGGVAEPELRAGTGPTTGNSAPPHASGSSPAGDAERPTGGAAAGGATAPAPLGERKGPGPRIALRNWRISTRLVSLLALPVVAATSLGALRINESMNEIEQLDNMKLLTEMTKSATELANALQEERDKSAGPLSTDTSVKATEIVGLHDRTQSEQEQFLKATLDFNENRSDPALRAIRQDLTQIAGQLARLKDIRREAYQGDAPSSQTIQRYNRLIEQLLDLSRDMALATSNPEIIQRTRILAAFSSAKEYASIQRAVIAAALPDNDSKRGEISETDRLYGYAAFDSESAARSSVTRAYEDAGGDAGELMRTLQNGPADIKESESYAKRVLESSSGIKTEEPRSYKDWTDQADTKLGQMRLIETSLLNEMEQEARNLRNESEQSAILNGAVILLVLGISLIGAFVVARSMIRSLRRLQDTATRVAQDRLPELVKQLSEADPQDVDTSVESVGVHSRDEIGQVAAAFDDVHREAVRLAAEQALLRGNVNAMFTNLSRRSQGLIQRQLSLISELESREADPDQLSSLFKLDHLATRMRRNGENLLVLAGEEPGRRWTRPVPLVDVLRAAASEVEQYERIELAAVPSTEVAGRVVNDLVHLLAELLENATSFSSPQTKVKVTGHALPDGRVLIEIHDTGIGLSPEDLAAINERLASPPTVDVSVSRRMGLFVVGRLSQRHGIRIQLRPSDSGGTTALVMLPVDVAQGGKKGPSSPGTGAGGGIAQAAAGAAAARQQTAGNQSAGRLAAPPQRSQVAGSGPRAALPGRDGGPAAPRPNTPQGNPQQGNAFGGPSQGGQQQGNGFGGGQQGNSFGGQRGGAQGGRGGNAPQQPAAPQQQPQRARGDNRPQDGRQLPPMGGPRAELPGGNPQGRTPSWGKDIPQEHPRGHEEPESPGLFGRPAAGQGDRQGSQGPGSTAQFDRPDFNGPRPAGIPNPPAPVRPQAPQRPQGPESTGQFAQPGMPERPQAPQGGPGQRDTADFAVPRPPAPRPVQPQQPVQPPAPARPQQSDNDTWALPPASGPGDGRTPLYDTLETNWFQQQGQQQNQAPQQPQAPQQSQQQSPLPPRPQQAPAQSATWRNSPNDELGRQAERVRQPSAGGVTTSGLPRRVPRANLVAGTAEQQQHQGGPQVSRRPDDVRGRLTNLRRGIQQGRQAGSGDTGSFPSPSHQQER
ncbi:nitrate- and nitrite sensing domain-containing protein [Streptomyces sp. TRM66268-LWL]|uniref:histidine kinase n=1 Tax=Streptomyces polyasparticus TaxID=2767826 RepID=A0ABR7SAS9_9ACTN|nr:nitrate- and nitrite sensing domain-containing protein [Streptomyces polyasparticus]MBC9711596.1 nitrate- and nitrite sensing domain-containing protein [Streptomyces polyasparticus]